MQSTLSAWAANIPIYKISKSGNEISVKTESNFSIIQKNQILTIGDFCNECGNCNTFCPTNGAPYKTKPIFYLKEESFDNESVGYYFKDGILKFKNRNGIESLHINESYFVYRSELVEVRFSKDFLSLIDIKFLSDSVREINLHQAAEMCFLIRNLKDVSIFK